jgi:hypothetical protein
VTLVEMGTHLATERVGMVTLHLTVGASELYPNRNRSAGTGSKPPSAAVDKSHGREHRRKRPGKDQVR